MKICKECNLEYSGFLISHSSKYCSDICRKTVRGRVNKKNEERRADKISSGDINFIAKDAFLRYKRESTKRGLVFNLTLDFFIKHVNAPCYYCGDLIIKVGFDRLDNNVGYIESNSVPCCAVCNFMKRNMNLDLFIEKCIKISYNHKK